MSDTFQAITFTFEGRAEYLGAYNNGPQVPPRFPNVNPNPPVNPPNPPFSPPEQLSQSEVINLLNGKADSIAQQLEREIRRFLPPQTSVQAEVSFSEGSIMMTGTILLIQWLGSTALAAARDEFSNQFKEVIRVGIQRVLSRVLRDFPGLLGPMEIDPIRVDSPETLSSHGEESTEDTGRLANWLKVGITLVGINTLLTLLLVLGQFATSTAFQSKETSSPSPTNPVSPSPSPASPSPIP